jgi:hypothetical protein
MNTDKTSLENETQPSCLGAVSGSASSEPNPIAQPQMWVDWYQIVYGGNEQEAKKEWGKKMYLLGY